MGRSIRPRPNAAVLGASGHIGSALVRALLERGHRVTAISRRGGAARNLAGLAVEHRHGDIGDPTFLGAVLPGRPWVFHAAAPYPLDASDRAAIRRAAQQTDTLIDAARDAAVERIIVTSSFVTERHPGALRVPATWLHPYFRVKREVEARVLEAHARRGLPAVLVLPTACVGPYDLKPQRLSLVAQVLAGTLPVLVDHAVNLIDVRDLAAAQIAAAERAMPGSRYLIGGENTTLSSALRRLCAQAGVAPPRFVRGSTLAAAVAARALERIAGDRLPFTAPSLGALLLREARPMSSAAAERDLGHHPRPLEESWRDQIAWTPTE